MSRNRGSGFRVRGEPSIWWLIAGCIGAVASLYLTINPPAFGTPAAVTAVTYPRVVDCDPNGLVLTLGGRIGQSWTLLLHSGGTVYGTYDANDLSAITLDASAEDNKFILASDRVITVHASKVCIGPASGTSTVQLVPGTP